MGLRLIIAPHDITEERLRIIKEYFPDCIFYSQLGTARNANKAACLVIDNIGMLSRLYKYGYINYVGGGLKKTGVHNVLEAAVYGKVVLFGPYYQDYAEAVDLVLSGGGLPFNYHRKQSSILGNIIGALLYDNKEYTFRSEAAGEFVRSKCRGDRKDHRIYSGKTPLDQLIEELNGAVINVPAQFYLHFAIDPIFCFGINIKTVDRFDAAFIHGFISAEEFIDE